MDNASKILVAARVRDKVLVQSRTTNVLRGEGDLNTWNEARWNKAPTDRPVEGVCPKDYSEL